jgi:hypothetical protein
MAGHVRAQIRDAVAKLLTGAPLAGTRVYASRRFPLAAENLPALLVYTLAEDAAIETMSPPRFTSRDLDLVIEGVAQENKDLDAVLDQLAVAIETRLGDAFENPNSSLGQLVRNGVLQRTEVGFRPAQNADEAGTGHIVLTWRVNYRTRSKDPTLIT